MQIVYILHSTDPTAGANKSLLTLLHGVRSHGITPIVITPDSNGIYSQIIADGFITHPLNFRPCTYPRTYGKVKGKLLFLPKLLARIYVNHKAFLQLTKIVGQYTDVALIHSNTCVIDIGWRTAKKLHLPHIFHIREYADIDFDMQFYPTQKRLYRMLSTPWCSNICITKDIQRHHHQQPNSHSVVIYNGIRNKVANMPLHQDANYFLYAGRLDRTKGTIDLLCSYSRYHSAETHPLRLLIAGRATNPHIQAEVESFITEHSLSSSVELLGQRTDIDVLMQSAKAVIIPSHNEGFGRVMPEAMFMGCPVIARNSGGSKEQMQNGLDLVGSSIALSFDDESSLVALLHQVTSMDNEQLSTITKPAFSVVNTLYTTEKYIDEVEKVYKKIIQEE